MGCGVSFSSRKNPSKSIQNPQKPQLTSNNSVKTTADTNDLQSLSLKPAKTCSQQRPESLDGSEILENYSILQSLSITCADEYKSIQELCTSFLYFHSSFLHHVHSCCIPRFRFSKAMKVLMTHSYSKQSSQEDQIILCNKFPFFSVYPQFAKDFQVIEELLYLAKHLKKSESFLQDLLKVEFVLSIFDKDEKLYKEVKDGVEILKSCAIQAREVLMMVEKIGKETQEFFWDYWNVKDEALNISNQLRGYKDYSIEDVVHFMYMENLITM
jgi:hypothetical protein